MANVGFRSGMRAHVLYQLTTSCKGFLTALALIRSDASMRSQVQFQAILDRKRFFAIIANEDISALQTWRVFAGDVVLQ